VCVFYVERGIYSRIHAVYNSAGRDASFYFWYVDHV